MMLRLRPHDVSPVLSSLAVLASLVGTSTMTTAFSILDVLALTGDVATCPAGCPLCQCINATESTVDKCTRTRSVEACASNALDDYTPVCWAGGMSTSRGCAPFNAATAAADSSRTCSGPSSVDYATYSRAAAIVRPRGRRSASRRTLRTGTPPRDGNLSLAMAVAQAAVAAVVVAAVAEQWSSPSLAVYH